SRFAAVPAVGPRDRVSRQEARHQVVVASGWRRLPAAREPRLPRVLHLLPAPHPGRLPRPIHLEHRRRDRAPVRSGAAAVRHLPRPVVHRAARAGRRAVRGDQDPRPDDHLRGRNAPRPPRRRPARQAVRRRVPRHELRRRVARSGDAQEVGPPAYPADAPADDHRALSQEGDRHRGVLRARVPAGRLELDRRDDRLRHGPRLALRAVQDPHAVSRDADVQADRTAAGRARLGEVRRVHGHLQTPEPDDRGAAVPARRGVQAVLHAPLVPRELPEDQEPGGPRLGQPDGRARQPAPRARGNRRHLPAGSEIIFPSLTFWVVPELARAAGLEVVFADVDPTTFTIDPKSAERMITAKTRAIVPTHLYGLACDMDAVMALAEKHNLIVLEDCAHALGATFKGKAVGTFGSGALFSFQTLKPLNCYGGGAALLMDPALAAKVRALVDALPWPDEKRVRDRLLTGRLQRIFIKPWVFSISLFPVLWVSALIDANPDVFLWEKIRSLHPLPEQYTERFPNVQAAIGLER